MTHQQYTLLMIAIKMIIKHDTEGYEDYCGKLHTGHTDLNMEYQLYGGYTKSLISNWSNNHPVRLDTIKTFVSDEIINMAISEKYITIPTYNGFARYHNNVVKLTAKGQRHILKALAN